jgi:hypothetical protein
VQSMVGKSCQMTPFMVTVAGESELAKNSGCGLTRCQLGVSPSRFLFYFPFPPANYLDVT